MKYCENNCVFTCRLLDVLSEWALTNKSGLEIRVSWTVGDHKENETVAAWGRRLKSRIPFTFSQTGNYTVGEYAFDTVAVVFFPIKIHSRNMCICR